MTLEANPVFLQNGGENAEQCRRAIGSLGYTSSGAPSPYSQPSGIAASGPNSTQLQVTQNGTPNMSVNIAEGGLWVPGTNATTQGSYYCFNNASLNLAIAAANISNPRIDLVCVTVQDSQYAGGSNNAIFQDVQGTPAGSPVAPAVPANSYVLAQVLVPANTSSIVTADITDKRSYVNSTTAGAVSMFGAANPFSGTLPSPLSGAPFLFQAWGITGGTTDGGGNITINFPTAFPNGCLYAYASLVFTGSFPGWELDVVSATASAVHCSLGTTNTNPQVVVINTAINYSGFAIGW